MMNLEKIKDNLFDFEKFSRTNLKISDKNGNVTFFKFNKGQRYLHKIIEEQKQKQGFVRIVVVKGRQQGISTYITGRILHQMLLKSNLRSFCFAHDLEASKQFNDMIKRYYDNLLIKPELQKSNEKGIQFSSLKSSYRIGTGKTKGLGRGMTNQILHWSEVDYTDNCHEHTKGILQTVPRSQNTEILLESTANQRGSFFYKTCMEGLKPDSEYKTIFIPWYWQDEYKIDCDELDLTNEENKYIRSYAQDGLTIQHLKWRRAKISEMNNDLHNFKREYPFTIHEAFEVNNDDCYIKSHLVLKALGTQLMNDNLAPLVMGVDPARLGGDRFVIALRQGRNLIDIKQLQPMDTVQSVQALIEIIQKQKPDKVFIDCGGLGVTIYDQLNHSGFANIIEKIDFGGKSNQYYYNKRAEIYGELKKWLEDEPVSIKLKGDKADIILNELSSIGYKYSNNSSLQLEPKEDIKKRLGFSPDYADAIALTFARRLAPKNIYMQNSQKLQYNDW